MKEVLAEVQEALAAKAESRKSRHSRDEDRDKHKKRHKKDHKEDKHRSKRWGSAPPVQPVPAHTGQGQAGLCSDPSRPYWTLVARWSAFSQACVPQVFYKHAASQSSSTAFWLIVTMFSSRRTLLAGSLGSEMAPEGASHKACRSAGPERFESPARTPPLYTKISQRLTSLLRRAIGQGPIRLACRLMGFCWVQASLRGVGGGGEAQQAPPEGQGPEGV